MSRCKCYYYGDKMGHASYCPLNKNAERCPRCKSRNIEWRLQERKCLDCGCMTIKEDFIEIDEDGNVYGDISGLKARP